MKTIINIGTSKKNIQGVEFDKPFKDITPQEIYDIVYKKFGKKEGVQVHGWCDVTEETKTKAE